MLTTPVSKSTNLVNGIMWSMLRGESILFQVFLFESNLADWQDSAESRPLQVEAGTAVWNILCDLQIA